MVFSLSVSYVTNPWLSLLILIWLKPIFCYLYNEKINTKNQSITVSFLLLATDEKSWDPITF